VKSSSRISAFLAYLLPIVGWIYVLLLRQKDSFAVYHTRQSIALILAAVMAPLAWAVVGWILAWVPILGAMAAAGLFALVVALWLFLLAAWIVGMVNALQGRQKPPPLVGRWADNLPGS
jgi:uncharacterized membrane protein